MIDKFSLIISFFLLASTPLLAQGQSEDTPTACRDGSDDDGDGLVDCEDDDCQVFVFCEPSDQENTAALCNDGADNDGDGHVDCDDQDCELLRTCVTRAPSAGAPQTPPASTTSTPPRADEDISMAPSVPSTAAAESPELVELRAREARLTRVTRVFGGFGAAGLLGVVVGAVVISLDNMQGVGAAMLGTFGVMLLVAILVDIPASVRRRGVRRRIEELGGGAASWARSRFAHFFSSSELI